ESDRAQHRVVEQLGRGAVGGTDAEVVEHRTGPGRSATAWRKGPPPRCRSSSARSGEISVPTPYWAQSAGTLRDRRRPANRYCNVASSEPASPDASTDTTSKPLFESASRSEPGTKCVRCRGRSRWNQAPPKRRRSQESKFGTLIASRPPGLRRR